MRHRKQSVADPTDFVYHAADPDDLESHDAHLRGESLRGACPVCGHPGRPRLYVAGVISGDPTRTHDEKVLAFREGAAVLEFRGYEAVVPLDIGNQHCADEGCADRTHRRLAAPAQSGAHSWECFLRHDLIEMLACDGVALLDGWHLSPGARLEFATATAVGLDCRPLDEWKTRP
jgi:hypothetical protein